VSVASTFRVIHTNSAEPTLNAILPKLVYSTPISPTAISLTNMARFRVMIGLLNSWH
ncbi:172_t:CDS:1, partial [Dentiscutata heterogama]